MKIEEAFSELRKGETIFNGDWNGINAGDKKMYLKIQNPDEHSLNTESYIMMYVVMFVPSSKDGLEGGWDTKRFPWIPSQLDIFSDNWQVRKKVEVKDAGSV